METRIYNGYKQFNFGNGWVFTHRAVAQKVLGNEIPEGHEVHHVNGDKLDNRPENLVVLPREEHQKLHRDSASDSSGSLTSVIGNYADFLLSNMVAADSAYLQVSATDMVVMQLKLSTIEMDISTSERTVQNLNEHGAIDGQDTSNGNSELQKQIEVCRKNIEGLMAEKEIIQLRLKESESRFNKQVQDVADKYSKIAENIASSLSGLFGGKR